MTPQHIALVQSSWSAVEPISGQALHWTSKQGQGDSFTEETEEAWTIVYGILSSTMKAAAAEVPASS